MLLPSPKDPIDLCNHLMMKIDKPGLFLNEGTQRGSFFDLDYNSSKYESWVPGQPFTAEFTTRTTAVAISAQADRSVDNVQYFFLLQNSISLNPSPSISGRFRNGANGIKNQIDGTFTNIPLYIDMITCTVKPLDIAGVSANGPAGWTLLASTPPSFSALQMVSNNALEMCFAAGGHIGFCGDLLYNGKSYDPMDWRKEYTAPRQGILLQSGTGSSDYKQRLDNRFYVENTSIPKIAVYEFKAREAIVGTPGERPDTQTTADTQQLFVFNGTRKTAGVARFQVSLKARMSETTFLHDSIDYILSVPIALPPVFE
jgi:hypothetical protein